MYAYMHVCTYGFGGGMYRMTGLTPVFEDGRALEMRMPKIVFFMISSMSSRPVGASVIFRHLPGLIWL